MPLSTETLPASAAAATVALGRLYQALTAFQDVDESMAVRAARLFLTAARMEGYETHAVAEAAGVTTGHRSKLFHQLGEGSRYTKSGLGLLYTIQSSDHGLHRLVYLTSKGKELVGVLEEALLGRKKEHQSHASHPPRGQLPS